MNKTQAKEYHSSLWRARCLQIIRADGGKFCQCGRKEPEVILQVHHKKYISGRKAAWQARYEEAVRKARKYNKPIQGRLYDYIKHELSEERRQGILP